MRKWNFLPSCNFLHTIISDETPKRLPKKLHRSCFPVSFAKFIRYLFHRTPPDGSLVHHVLLILWDQLKYSYTKSQIINRVEADVFTSQIISNQISVSFLPSKFDDLKPTKIM